MKKILIVLLWLALCLSVYAQDPEEKILRITDITGIQGDYVVGMPANVSNWIWNWTIDNCAGKRLLRQRMGYERIGGILTQNGTIQGLFWFTPSDADEQLVVVHAGRVYKYVLSTDSLYLKSGDSSLLSLCVGGMFSGQLVMCDGNAVARYNGSTVSAAAYDWSVWHSSLDRQWLSGNSDSVDVIAYTWPNADSIQGSVRIGYNDGFGVTAVSSLENYIYAHKPNGIWIITLHTTSYTDNQDNNVYAGTPATVYKSYAKNGAMNPRCLVSTNNGDYYVANDGVYVFRHGNVDKLSTAIDHYFKDSIDHCRTHLITAAINDDKFYFSYPTTACASTNSKMLVYDLETKSWYCFGVGTPYLLSDPSAEKHLFASGDSESPGREKLYWADNSSSGDHRVYVYGGLNDTTSADDGANPASLQQSGWWCGEEGGSIKKTLNRFWLTVWSRDTASIDLVVYENFSGTACHDETYPLVAGWNKIAANFSDGVQGEYFRFRAYTKSGGIISIEEWDAIYTVVGQQ